MPAPRVPVSMGRFACPVPTAQCARAGRRARSARLGLRARTIRRARLLRRSRTRQIMCAPTAMKIVFVRNDGHAPVEAHAVASSTHEVTLREW